MVVVVLLSLKKTYPQKLNFLFKVETSTPSATTLDVGDVGTLPFQLVATISSDFKRELKSNGYNWSKFVLVLKSRAIGSLRTSSIKFLFALSLWRPRMIPPQNALAQFKIIFYHIKSFHKIKLSKAIIFLVFFL